MAASAAKGAGVDGIVEELAPKSQQCKWLFYFCSVYL
jgi:hypothetical protein